MALPIEPPVQPMLAALTSEIPTGEAWLYEPKWDGFRAIVFKDQDQVALQSRNGQPLARYFPELVEYLRHALPPRCVVDGEIVVAGNDALDFDALLQRVHPAASRIAKLAKETPSSFVAFDLLALDRLDLRGHPFTERRALLEAHVHFDAHVLLTPQTDSPAVARRWFERFEGAGLDGVVAKRRDLPYVEGERVMAKIKHERTADCVVGGYRPHKVAGVGSLLLGLYDDEGVLRHVGHTSAFSAKTRKELLELLRPISHRESFAEPFAPGGPSRWNAGRDTSWVSVAPTLVCEVKFDHLQGERFRHAAGFLRWRPDKPPKECTFAQLRPPRPFKLSRIDAAVQV